MFEFNDYSEVRDKNLHWKCVLCNNEFLSNIFGKLPRCPKCFPIGNTGCQSSIEIEIISEIKTFYTGEIIENSRDIISPKEIDIYIPEYSLAIEVNGIYWHSDDKLHSNYHRQKFLDCKSKGISIMMVTDYEWKTNKNLVISMIKHRIKHTKNKIFARNCRINQIVPSVAREFHDNNHLSGFSNASNHIGLYHNDILVSVFSYSYKNRFSKNNEIEIVRFSTNNLVVGALGKFIKYLKNQYQNQDIISYADLRYGEGNCYLKLGFEFVHDTVPGYWYFIENKLYHRLSWTKQKLIKLGYDKNKTEKQIMAELGALRLYDCGHRLYKLKGKI